MTASETPEICKTLVLCYSCKMTAFLLTPKATNANASWLQANAKKKGKNCIKS